MIFLILEILDLIFSNYDCDFLIIVANGVYAEQLLYFHSKYQQ